MKTNVATEDTDKVFCYLSNVLHSALFMKLLRVISKNNHNKKKKNLVSSKTTLKEQFKKIFQMNKIYEQNKTKWTGLMHF